MADTRGVTLDEVHGFWQANPVWTGESRWPTGSRLFFEEHADVYRQDCLGGEWDSRLYPDPENRRHALDLGCGHGIMTVELGRVCERVTAADLTERALEITGLRCRLFGVEAELSRQNAERLDFPDATFSHVNCIGVIHHTPDTESCAREIARVLAPGGTAVIAVYYRNALIRHWHRLAALGKILASLGIGLKGRGRERLLAAPSGDELVRLYDGAKNPLGKSYTAGEFRELLAPHFRIDETFLHFFPARALPFPLPRRLHKWLDSRLGLMIYARVTKPREE